MFCTNCGQKIADNAKFCQNCGTPVSTDEEAVFTEAPATNVQQSGTLLTEWKLVSKYQGTPVAANSAATGNLFVYSDRIEFKKKMGNSRSAHSGLIGFGISVGLAKANPLEVFELNQISELRVGKYMGIYKTLVITLLSGETWSFTSAMPNSSEPQKIISLLNPYMQK